VADGGITFTDVTFVLSGQMQAANIFWVAGAAISSTQAAASPPNIPGIFIAGTSITFASAASISGRLYAKAAITFSAPSSVDDDLSIVCYVKGSLILTNQ